MGTKTAIAQDIVKVTPIKSSGFCISGKKLLAKKPTDVWRGRFHALRKGMGYPVDVVAAEWGTSPDTVREKAKDNGSLRYVESPDKPGQYMACVVHPATPTGE